MHNTYRQQKNRIHGRVLVGCSEKKLRDAVSLPQADLFVDSQNLVPHPEQKLLPGRPEMDTGFELLHSRLHFRNRLTQLVLELHRALVGMEREADGEDEQHAQTKKARLFATHR